MSIARVFPTKTSYSPTDGDAYFSEPGLFMPPYDEVHISVLFSWDIERAKYLMRAWDHIAPVKIGGFAIGGESREEFTPGWYVKKGVTITSRGCPSRCPWCMVKSPLKEIAIHRGNIVQDNNLLACSNNHIKKVFDMLRGQKQISFPGGLDCTRLKDWHVEELRGLSIHQLWLAYDDECKFKYFKSAVERLSRYFNRDKIRAYVLIGFDSDTIAKAEARLRGVYLMGSLPFAMLYRDYDGSCPNPEKEWRQFQRSWARPAAIKTIMGHGN